MLARICKQPLISSISARYIISKVKTIQDIPDVSHSAQDLAYGTVEAWQQMVKDNKNNEVEMVQWQSFGYKRAVCPLSNEAIKDIYRLENQGIVNGSRPPHIFALLGRKSIVHLEGREHSSLRNNLNPFFTLESMRHRFNLVNELTKDLLGILYGKTIENGGDGVHLYTETKSFAFGIGLRAVFGDLCTEAESHEMLNNLETWYAGFGDPNIENLNDPNTVLGKGMLSKYKFEELIVTVWRKGIAAYNNNTLDKNSTIFGLIQSGEIREEDIGELMLTIVFASYETTASSACNIVWNMYRYKEETEILKQNIEDLDLTDFDAVMNDKYLDSFVKESMRALPVVTSVDRLLKQECTYRGIELEKGTFLTVPFAVMNCDESTFDKPEKFDGQRFLSNPPKRNTFLPFGMGMHKCLGEQLAMMEIKCVTARLIKECETNYIDETRIDPGPTALKYANVFGQFAPLSI